MENLIGNEKKEKFGVQDHDIDNNHYVVSIIGRDGKKYERVFPVAGFTVVDPTTDAPLCHISGKKALKILEEHSAEFTADEFSWISVIRQKIIDEENKKQGLKK